MNLLNDRSAMQAHLSLHGWYASCGKASFDEVMIWRIANREQAVVLSIREGEKEIFRMKLQAAILTGSPSFDQIPDSEWRRLVRRAIDLNLVEGFDGKESSARAENG